MRNDFESNYLMHHGIMGQKWGVKHGPPYPLDVSQKSKVEKKASTISNNKVTNKETSTKSSMESKGLTDKQKQYIKRGAIAAGVALAVVGGMYLYKKSGLWYRKSPVPNVDIRNLSTKALTISKNTKLQRISTKPIEDYVKQGKSVYASYLKRDNTIYKEQMPRNIKKWSKLGIVEGKNAYVHELNLKRDIKIASEKDVVDAYMKATKTDQFEPMYYNIFMRQLHDRDLDMNASFIKDLQAKGYDGMIDFNDALNNTTKSPLLLFDASDIIESSQNHKLGKLERFINVMKS